MANLFTPQSSGFLLLTFSKSQLAYFCCQSRLHSLRPTVVGNKSKDLINLDFFCTIHTLRDDTSQTVQTVLGTWELTFICLGAHVLNNALARLHNPTNKQIFVYVSLIFYYLYHNFHIPNTLAIKKKIYMNNEHWNYNTYLK